MFVKYSNTFKNSGKKNSLALKKGIIVTRTDLSCIGQLFLGKKVTRAN